MDDGDECPLCCEKFEEHDYSVELCTCSYMVCGFCYDRLRRQENGCCPGCRKKYGEPRRREAPLKCVALASHFCPCAANAHLFHAYAPLGSLSPASCHTHKPNRKKDKQKGAAAAAPTRKAVDARSGGASSGGGSLAHVIADAFAAGNLRVASAAFPVDPLTREALKDVRVIQKNLIYITNLPPLIAGNPQAEELLRSDSMFGQYGSISRVILNTSREEGASAHITFERDEDAARAVWAVDGFWLNKKMLRVELGTNKYCTGWLKAASTPKSGGAIPAVCSTGGAGCRFLHALAPPELCVGATQLRPGVSLTNPNRGRLNANGVKGGVPSLSGEKACEGAKTAAKDAGTLLPPLPAELEEFIGGGRGSNSSGGGGGGGGGSSSGAASHSAVGGSGGSSGSRVAAPFPLTPAAPSHGVLTSEGGSKKASATATKAAPPPTPPVSAPLPSTGAAAAARPAGEGGGLGSSGGGSSAGGSGSSALQGTPVVKGAQEDELSLKRATSGLAKVAAPFAPKLPLAASCPRLHAVLQRLKHMGLVREGSTGDLQLQAFNKEALAAK